MREHVEPDGSRVCYAHSSIEKPASAKHKARKIQEAARKKRKEPPRKPKHRKSTPATRKVESIPAKEDEPKKRLTEFADKVSAPLVVPWEMPPIKTPVERNMVRGALVGILMHQIRDDYVNGRRVDAKDARACSAILTDAAEDIDQNQMGFGTTNVLVLDLVNAEDHAKFEKQKRDVKRKRRELADQLADAPEDANTIQVN